jgi:hypothetical protein
MVARFTRLALGYAWAAWAALQGQSPEALLKEIGEDSVFNCGSMNRLRSAVAALGRTGAPGVQLLDPLVGRIERGDTKGMFYPDWILIAYAMAAGAEAAPRLQALLDKTVERPLTAWTVRMALAHAHGSTAIVNGGDRWGAEPGYCNVGVSPQISLSRFLAAVLRGDRSAAGEQLVSSLQDAWNAVSSGDAGLRALPGSSTVEYRFDGETEYSLPEEPGDPENGLPYVPWDERSAPTTFLDKAGKPCASKAIRFQFVRSSAKGRRYLIAEADLAGLMRVVRQCRY